MLGPYKGLITQAKRDQSTDREHENSLEPEA